MLVDVNEDKPAGTPEFRLHMYPPVIIKSTVTFTLISTTTNVWNTFGFRIIEKYVDLYFCETCLDAYKLDSAHYLSEPSLT